MHKTAVVSQWLVRTHGQGRINLEVIRALAAAGHDVTAVSTTLEQGTSATWDQVNVPGRLPTNWARETVFRLSGGRRARAWRRMHPKGLLITNGAAVADGGDVNLAMFVHAAWLRSRWHPARTTRGPHARFQASYNAVNARAERHAFNAARVVVALNELVRDELIEHAGVPADRIVCIPPGVDTGEFRPLGASEPNALREACGLATADSGGPAMLALFAGEIRTGRKNLDLVLKALAAVPAMHLAVAGSTTGSLYPAKAVELGVAERVYWLGHRTDLPALMRGADAFVFPSHYEPFGLVVTEAMASGVPVIVTRQCGAAAFVAAGAGVVIDDGAALETVVETLRRWLADPTTRAAAGQAARAAAERYTWRDMAARYVRLVNELGPA